MEGDIMNSKTSIDILKQYHIVAVVGSQSYSSPKVFEHILNERSRAWLQAWPLKVAFISGGAIGVDTDFREWCRKSGPRHSFFIEVTPIRAGEKENNFLRNSVIASLADELIGFIQRNKYQSGTWNTINHFRKMGKMNYKVFDKQGEEWDRKWKGI